VEAEPNEPDDDDKSHPHNFDGGEHLGFHDDDQEEDEEEAGKGETKARKVQFFFQ